MAEEPGEAVSWTGPFSDRRPRACAGRDSACWRIKRYGSSEERGYHAGIVTIHITECRNRPVIVHPGGEVGDVTGILCARATCRS